MKKNKLTNALSRFFGFARKKIYKSQNTNGVPIDFSAPSIPYYSELAERFSAAKMIAYIALFTFVLGTIIFGSKLITYDKLYYLVKDINAAAEDASRAADHLSYPTSGTSQSYALYREGLVVAGEHEITVMSASGKQTLTDNVAYTTPCVSSGDKYFIAYGRGERSFAVYNSFVRIYSESTEYPVYLATMSDSGTFAVLTRSREQKSVVNIYDADMQKVMSYSSSGYVTDVSLSENGDRAVLSILGSGDSDGGTRLVLLNVGKNEAKATVTLEESVVYRACFMDNNRIAAVCSDSVRIYDFNGKNIFSSDYKDDPPALYDVTNDGIALLYTSESSSAEIILYDKNGKSVYNSQNGDRMKIELREKPRYICMSGTDVYVLSDSELKRLDRSGDVVSLTTPDDKVEQLFIRDSGAVLAATMSYATVLGGT